MIEINSRWSIDSDPRNYILMETHETVSKETGMPTGKTVTSNYGFYPSLSHAIKAIAKQEGLDMIASGNMTLREAINRMDEIDREMYDRFVDADGRC